MSVPDDGEHREVMTLLREIKDQLNALSARVEGLCKTPLSTSGPMKIESSPEFVVS